MKKIYLLALLTVFVGSSFAQRSYSGVKKNQKLELSAKTPSDTLYPESCLTGTPSIYLSDESGYIFGNNNYGDLAKAQQFVVTTTYNVEGMIVWVDAKHIVGDTGTVDFNLYAMDGTGYSSLDTNGNAIAPGTVLASVTKKMDEIDTADYTYVNFANPVPVLGDYALGFDLSSIGDDTLGVMSTTDQDAGFTELVWEKWSDGTWSSSYYAWEIDVDMFVFAVVDKNAAGVNDNYFINGIKLSQNQPNPVNGSTMISYELENAASVSLDIFDITGKLVLSTDEGMQNAGLHNIVFDANKIEKGTYFYSLKAGNNRLTKKMIIQ